MSEKDVDKKAEMLERSRKVSGGTAEGTASVRQALTARGDKAKDGVPLLIEEVLRRENVLRAFARLDS